MCFRMTVSCFFFFFFFVWWQLKCDINWIDFYFNLTGEFTSDLGFSLIFTNLGLQFGLYINLDQIWLFKPTSSSVFFSTLIALYFSEFVDIFLHRNRIWHLQALHTAKWQIKVPRSAKKRMHATWQTSFGLSLPAMYALIISVIHLSSRNPTQFNSLIILLCFLNSILMAFKLDLG